MSGQLLALVCVVALTVQSVVAEEDPCLDALNACTAAFETARFDDWEALDNYDSCCNDVECEEGTYGGDQKASLLEDIANKKLNWGRDWDIINSASYTGRSLAFTVAVALVTTFVYTLRSLRRSFDSARLTIFDKGNLI